MEKTKEYTSPYEMDGRIPWPKAIVYGLQHVLAMFVGNLTPLLIITAACGIEAGGELQVALLQNAMLIAGIVTLVQVFTVGPVGGKLPIVMGTSSGFIGVCQSVAGVMGNGVVAYGAIMAASFIGGLFETVLGSFLKPLRKFFPSVVTGTVVLSIGLSLIAVGISSFGGGSSAKDYGSLENLFVGFVVLVVIVVLKHGTKGFTSFASILIGIIVGYVLVSIMAAVLPTTFTYVDDAGATVEATKSWVLNWDKVASASWFAVPKIMPVKWVFDARAIVPICIMFIVTAVETVGDISGITEGGLGREATDKELSGGVMCDGLGSSLAAVFGVLPNTSFSQNVGLVAMNKVVNRFSIATGGIFLIACGLFPKLAALISIMPQSVLGGAAVMMFSSIVVSGIQLITKWPIGPRNVTIVSVALGLGYGLGSNTAILVHLPQAISLIFGGSGIVPAGAVVFHSNVLRYSLACVCLGGNARNGSFCDIIFCGLYAFYVRPWTIIGLASDVCVGTRTDVVGLIGCQTAYCQFIWLVGSEVFGSRTAHVCTGGILNVIARCRAFLRPIHKEAFVSCFKLLYGLLGRDNVKVCGITAVVVAHA